jgi:hypothetical protein
MLLTHKNKGRKSREEKNEKNEKKKTLNPKKQNPFVIKA